MKISICVPIYNAELYLNTCLNSISKQTYKDLEIILVDDGSTDNSLDICNEWAKCDTRIKVIHKENEGVSVARNTALDIATGDYVTFLDSDDYLDLDIVEKCANCINEYNNVDFLYKFGYSIIEGEHKISGPRLFADGITYPEMLSYAMYPSNKKFQLGKFFRSVWGTVFNLKIIQKNKIKFPIDLYIGEDAIFLMRYFTYTKSIKIVCSEGYNYRIVSNSAVHRYKKDLYEQSITQRRYIDDILKSSNLCNNKEIMKSKVLFDWWIFNMLSKNSNQGYKEDVLSKKDVALEADFWYKKYKAEMKSKMVVTMSKRIKIQYLMSFFVPEKILYRIAII